MKELRVYFKDGRTFDHQVLTESVAREYMSKILKEGYRCREIGEHDLSWYGPHYIDKITMKEINIVSKEDIKDMLGAKRKTSTE